MTHIDDLVAYVRGEIGEAETASAREHVLACADCAKEVEALQAVFGTLASTQVEAPSNFAWRVMKAASEQQKKRRSLWDRVAEIAVKPVFGYPAWGLSAAVHLIALGVLTFVAVEKIEKRRKENDAPKFAFTGVPKGETGRPLDETGTVAPPSGEFAAFLGRRTEDAHRAEQLKRFGAQGTEASVQRGLSWLAARQQPDGAWPVEGGIPEYRTGTTGLAALAFLAHGDSHLGGTNRAVVARALDFLRAQQTRSGRIGPDRQSIVPQHAVATAALAEAFLLTGDVSLREPLSNAVEYLAASRSPRGGWGASMGASPDSITTAWSAMALRLADAAGVEAARGPLAAAASYLDALTSADGRTGLREAGTYPNGWESPTAAALFARRWTGLPSAELKSRAAALSAPAEDYAGLQFAALASIGTDGFAPMHQALQSLRGRQNADGSFPADRWAGYGGSVASTAMATLALETYFRYPTT